MECCGLVVAIPYTKLYTTQNTVKPECQAFVYLIVIYRAWKIKNRAVNKVYFKLKLYGRSIICQYMPPIEQ